jgi:hypothetical protein
VREPRNYMSEHHPHFGTAYFVSKDVVSPGDVVTFDYKGKTRYVFVLDGDFEGKLHGLTLELTPRATLRDTVIDAMYDTAEPVILYERAVYKVAKSFDSYRTYFVDEIKLLRRMPYYLKAKPKVKK